MKIKNISCTQFAGISNQDISLTDGVNVIYGKNESGKSTLVNLMLKTLFQNAKIDKRRDKEFMESCFPSQRKNGHKIGDFADGKITITENSCEYVLEKEWGEDNRCILSTDQGKIRDQKKIDKILKNLLGYGAGVYSDILFTNQRNADISLQTLLDSSKKTDAKQEIINVISKAFAQSDGISIDEIEENILKKIDDIAGKHWDYERNAPKYKSGRWATGLGEILKAYYACEDAKNVLSEVSILEMEADNTSISYAQKDEDLTAFEKKYNKFKEFYGQLSVQNERKRAISRLETDIKKYEEVLKIWPKLTEKFEKSQKLHTELQDRQLLDTYFKAKILQNQITDIKIKMESITCPTEEEVMAVKSAEKNIDVLSNKLCGINLNAAVKMFGNNQLEIISLRTGERLNISENVIIDEAVCIKVPNVFEMVITPANIDAEDIKNKIAENKQFIQNILTKYKVQYINDLETLVNDHKRCERECYDAQCSLKIVLGNSTLEQIETAVDNINRNPRKKEEIDKEIALICDVMDISRFIVATETQILAYKADYESSECLEKQLFDAKQEHKILRKNEENAKEIPEEYKNIAAPEIYLEKMETELEKKRKDKENALALKLNAASKLEAYKENITGDPVVNEQIARRELNDVYKQLTHWLNIKKVFTRLKNELNDNPMNDIADKFAHYLSIISNEKISAEFANIEKLDMNIYSSDRLIDYDKLSEGTKETVALSFRLSVVEHLFPDGGGVVVLDDPFVNMDADRTKQSIKLIEECAKRHQVIFLTCKGEYLDKIKGNVVNL